MNLQKIVGKDVWKDVLELVKAPEKDRLLYRVRAESEIQDRMLNGDKYKDQLRHGDKQYLLLRIRREGGLKEEIMWEVGAKYGQIPYSKLKLKYVEKVFDMGKKKYILRYLIPTDEKLRYNKDKTVKWELGEI
jgi:hypothetical protein